MSVAIQPLHAPDFGCPFILQTDASDTGLAAVLSLEKGGEEHPVVYISRKLTPAETHYAAVEKEALAIKWAILELKYYLLGRTFTLVTDHAPLQWMARAKDTNAHVTRWFLALQDFHFMLQHGGGASRPMWYQCSLENSASTAITMECVLITDTWIPSAALLLSRGKEEKDELDSRASLTLCSGSLADLIKLLFSLSTFFYFFFTHNTTQHPKYNKTKQQTHTQHLKVQSKGRERGKDNKNTNVTPLYNHVYQTKNTAKHQWSDLSFWLSARHPTHTDTLLQN